MIKSINRIFTKLALLLLTVSLSHCSTYKIIHKFNATMKRDTSHYPMLYPPYHQVAGNNILDYSSISVGCRDCNSFHNYRIVSYDVYFMNKKMDTNKHIGIYNENYFSPKLRKIINRNAKKYFSIEFRNIIVIIDSSKIINVGNLVTYMSENR